MKMGHEEPQSDTAEKATNTLPPPEKNGWLAKKIGNFAFNHRDFFDGTTGRVVFNNFAKVVVGVVPTAAAFLLTRMGQVRADKFLASHPGKLSDFSRTFTDSKNHATGAQTLFIIGGFAVFREFCKLWQRSYERLFARSDDAKNAIDTVSNLPKQVWKDVKDITGPEWAGTTLSALPLAAVKIGFLNSQTYPVPPSRTATKAEAFAQARRGFPNDVGASIPAYAAFFALNNGLYDFMTEGKDGKKHYARLNKKTEDGPDPLQNLKNGKGFTASLAKENGLGRMVFGKVAPLMIGVAGFMGAQRFSRAQFGAPDMTQTGANAFMHNLFKDYAQFVGFTLYTVPHELYSRAYEKVLTKLNDKKQQQNPDMLH